MSKLFSELKIDKLLLKNRIVMPPMCTYRVANEDGCPTDFHALHYGARALGGVGMIIVEATAVQANGRITSNDLGLYDDAQIEGHKKIVNNIKAYGAIPAIQLNHAGRKAKVENNVSVSDMRFSDEYASPIVLTEELVEKFKQDFLAAAIRAKHAGYELIEIHAAHGYLLNTFLSPLINNRNWKYGGNLEKRCCILKELCELLKPLNLALGIRISATSWRNDDYGIEEMIEVSKLCEKLGISYIHVSSGGVHAETNNGPVVAPLYQAEYAKKIKEAVSIPVIAVGIITTASEGEALLLGNTCDAVAYGRALLNNANLPFEMAAELKENERIDPTYLRAYRLHLQKLKL